MRTARKIYITAALVAAFGVSARAAFAYRTSGESIGISFEAAPRWGSGILKFDVYSDLPRPLVASTTFEDIIAGFRVWESLDCAALELDARAFTTEPPVHGDGRNTVAWVKDWKGASEGADLAATTDITYEEQPDGTWRIIEADILLNANVPWSNDATTIAGTEVFGVVAHEAGHFLGLDHPCELDGSTGVPICGDAETSSLLFPSYLQKLAGPNADDRTGVCALYPFAPEVCAVPLSSEMPAKCADFCSTNQCPVIAAGVTGGNETGAGGAGAVPVAEDGDPCRSDRECKSGGCEAGFCSSSCAVLAQSCPAGISGFGAQCSNGTSCISRLCLEVNPGQDMCTRPCSMESNDCPSGHVCRAIDGQDACVPIEPGGEVGCGCALATPRSFNSATLILALIGLVARRLQRRQRSVRASTQFGG